MRLAVVKKGEEEVLYDRPPHQQKILDGDLDVDYNNNDDVDKDMETNTNANTTKKKETASTKSIQSFCKQNDDTIVSATFFMYDYLQQNQVMSIDWTILSDTEYITDNDKIDLPLNDEVEMLKDIDGINMNEALFDTIFPSIVGHGKIIDEFIVDQRAEYHRACQHKKIVIDDPNNDKDRDWKVKHCYTLLIAAVGELECGVDNLWKKGITR
eukprot:2639682-Ditylum_brightwellii.AAC.1